MKNGTLTATARTGRAGQTVMKTVLLALALSAGILSAQDVPHTTVYYTENFGRHLRDYPVPEGTVFTVRKTGPDELRRLLQDGKVRFAVTREALGGKGLKTEKLAFEALILAVHPANSIRDITLQQARDLLEKHRGSWRTFNGPSARIRLYVKADPEPPPPVMGHGRLHEHARPQTILDLPPLGAGQQKATGGEVPKVNYSRPLIIKTESDSKSFSMLCTDPLGMACFDITRFDEDRVPLLKIGHIPPTLENFRSGSYPLTVTYYLISPESPSPNEQKLLRYLRSVTFAGKLYKAGLLPEKPQSAKKKRAPAKKSLPPEAR